MSSKYFVVEKSLLPPHCEKVALAKHMIADGEAKDVSDADREGRKDLRHVQEYREALITNTGIMSRR